MDSYNEESHRREMEFGEESLKELEESYIELKGFAPKNLYVSDDFEYQSILMLVGLQNNYTVHRHKSKTFVDK